MKYSKLTPDKAITCKPGLELDVFIYEYIFDGVRDDEAWKGNVSGPNQIPSFSKNASANKILLIRMFAEVESLSIETCFGQQFSDMARDSGQITTDKIIPVWLLEAMDVKAFGRTHEEAVAKLAIQFKMKGYLA